MGIQERQEAYKYKSSVPSHLRMTRGQLPVGKQIQSHGPLRNTRPVINLKADASLIKCTQMYPDSNHDFRWERKS